MRKTIKLYLLAAIASLLCLATLGLFNCMPHYQVMRSEALTTSFISQQKNLKNGEIVINLDNSIRLENRTLGQKLVAYADIKIPASRLVNVSIFGLQLSNVLPTETAWQQARIEIIAFDSSGNSHWDFDNTLLHQLGSANIEHLDKTIYIPETYPHARLEISLPGNVGQLKLASASVNAANPLILASLLERALMLLWALLIATTFYLVARQQLTVALGFVLVGVLLTLIPATEKAYLISYFPSAGDIDTSHIVLFAVTGSFTRIMYRRESLGPVFLGLLVTSYSTEVLQYFSPQRNPGIGDWLSNVVGLGAGLICAEIILRYQRRMKPA